MAVHRAIPLLLTLDIMTETDECAEKWQAWKNRWNSYATIAKLSGEDASYQLELFQYCLSDNNLRLVDKGLSFDDQGDRQKLDKIIEQFHAHFAGGQNEIHESYRFFTRQQDGESLRAHITELKILAKSCNFAALEDKLMRDRIVCSMLNKPLQKVFLEDSSLTLAKCEKRCRSEESAAGQVRQMGIKNEQRQVQLDIDAVQTSRREAEGWSKDRWFKCRNCGRQHSSGRCPAHGLECRACGKLNHFAAVCLQKQRKPNGCRQIRQVGEREVVGRSEDSDFRTCGLESFES